VVQDTWDISFLWQPLSTAGKKKSNGCRYQDYLLLILTTSCLGSLSKNGDNYFSEKETLICTLGKYKQYSCSYLQKTLVMLSAVFEIIIIILSVKS